ncbi:TIR domain-containing protein [Acinetobacter chinensis]|uniref:TIR domain-containing protein n=1 Tax=Acinetobacter chinensis TaxID=2004650 RepID=A0ABU3WHD7_9GAMM|nr:TIR domain-containing protein [Acinetobacter chinensis]MDV2469819.1 TIR domain-containing protein [Acinetobacter chinensis]
MAYKNGNYAAFYVADEELVTKNPSSAHFVKDFNYYQMFKAWKAKDSSFPFNDSHEKTYNVRDTSNWDTLKGRLRERLNNSKNIILFLSENTTPSRALTEEIEYAIDYLELPLIIVYVDIKSVGDIFYRTNNNYWLSQSVINLKKRLPILKDCHNKVPCLHIPLRKEVIIKALSSKNFMLATKRDSGNYIYNVD